MADEIYMASRSPVPPSGDVIVHSGPVRRISWGGVFAGLFLVLSIQLLLIMLGFGVGLSVFQPGRGLPSPGTISIDAAAWWVGSYIVRFSSGAMPRLDWPALCCASTAYCTAWHQPG